MKIAKPQEENIIDIDLFSLLLLSDLPTEPIDSNALYYQQSLSQ